jgi:outer membrane protein OmpA-like peptidoglycan-associated protein
MTLRLLVLATSAALLTLAGCATQHTGPDPTEAANQRLSSLEARLQDESGATHVLIGDLGTKVDALSDDLRRMRETVAARASRESVLADQAAQANSGSAARQAATDALAARMDKEEQRLQELADATQAATNQAAGAQAALRETGQKIERLGAQSNQQSMDQALARQAETAALDERLEAAEGQLKELDGQIKQASAQTGAVQAALPALTEKVDAAAPRLNDYEARLAALSKRLEEVAAMAQDALDATGLGQRKIFGKVIESITLTEDKTLFPINSPDLGEQDKAKLDALALRLKALGTNYHLQIQGHTEGFGAEDYNYELGRARAEVVKNYLNEKDGIPLLRMSVISYGSLDAGRYAAGSNRRIVVQVLQ